MTSWNMFVGEVGLRVIGIWGEVRCGGASPEDGGPKPLHITRREKGVKSAGDQTGC